MDAETAAYNDAVANRVAITNVVMAKQKETRELEQRVELLSRTAHDLAIKVELHSLTLTLTLTQLTLP